MTPDALYDDETRYLPILGQLPPLRSTLLTWRPTTMRVIIGTGDLLTGNLPVLGKHGLCAPQFLGVCKARPEATIAVLTSAVQVEYIREHLQLNITELSEILHVGRPTVYAWIKGQTPHPDSVVQIRQLAEFAELVQLAGIPRLDTLLHRPVFQGRSLVDRLKAGERPIDAITTLQHIAQYEVELRQAPKGATNTPRPLDEIAADHATPFDDSRQ